MSKQSEAHSDLVWASLPLKDVLRGEQRAAFIRALTASTATLSGRTIEHEADAPQHPREAAEQMHRQCLLACIALGVPARDLVPQFNQLVESNCAQENTAPYRLAELGKAVASTAFAMLDQNASDK